jgi:hypothetical protein
MDRSRPETGYTKTIILVETKIAARLFPDDLGSLVPFSYLAIACRFRCQNKNRRLEVGTRNNRAILTFDCQYLETLNMEQI